MSRKCILMTKANRKDLIDLFEEKIYNSKAISGGHLKYLQYNAAANEKSPLLIYLHGAGSRGSSIFFGECGCSSRVGTATCPSGFSEGSYSGEEQANYLTAVVETFKNEPWWLGLAWWKWDDRIKRSFYTSDPKSDIGFTIKGKPAEKLFTKYTEEFSK